jgi:uncharacterized protein YggT (Ycf19 family)
MDAPLEPRRRVIREEAVYQPIEPAVQPVAQPIVEQPVVAAQPGVPARPVVPTPVVGVQPVAQPVVQPVEQPVVQTVLPQAVATAHPVVVEPAPAVDSQRSYSQVGDMRVENVRQGFYDAAGNLVERQEQVFDDPYARRLNVLDRTARIIYFVMGVLEVLLALRFLFRVINAETTNGLVNFVYNFTAPFVAPFNGIFNDQSLQRGSLIEISTLLAMVLYSILTYGIIQLLYLLFTPGRSSRSVFSSTRRRGR